MKLHILIITLLPALALANQNLSLPKTSCPLGDIEFTGQAWGMTSETTWQECGKGLKANVSQEILNWHSLRHSHSADICIHFYCLS